jgi:hypothetical protein
MPSLFCYRQSATLVYVARSAVRAMHALLTHSFNPTQPANMLKDNLSAR